MAFLRRTTRRQKRFALWPTQAGLAFLLATAITGAVALHPSGNILLIMFGLFVGAIAVNVLAGWISLRRLSISRDLPDAAIAGQPNVVRYELRSRRRLANCYGLRIVDVAIDDATGERRVLEAFIPALRPRTTLTVPIPVIWHRRANIRFERLSVRTRFPFGLVEKSYSISHPAEVVVYPPLKALRSSVWQLSRDTNAAAAISEAHAMRKGGDEEFYGLREFRHGDNPRRIHWRRSARTGQVFVREMARPRSRQMWCILNTRISGRSADERDRLEAAISGVATVLCDALERGGKIGLLTNGSPALLNPPGSGRKLRGRLLRELARLPVNSEHMLFDRLTRIGWPTRWRAPCMLFCPLIDDDVTRSARWLTMRVGRVTMLAPGTAAFDALFAPRAAGADAWPKLDPVESLG